MGGREKRRKTQRQEVMLRECGQTGGTCEESEGGGKRKRSQVTGMLSSQWRLCCTPVPPGCGLSVFPSSTGRPDSSRSRSPSWGAPQSGQWEVGAVTGGLWALLVCLTWSPSIPGRPALAVLFWQYCQALLPPGLPLHQRGCRELKGCLWIIPDSPLPSTTSLSQKLRNLSW